MLRRIVPLVVLLAALFGGAAIALVGRVEFRPGTFTVAPTADVSRYPQEYGPSTGVLASFPVTVEDLDALGIDHGDWAKRTPAMELVMLHGAYQVPVLSLSPRGAHLYGEYKIYVRDLDHGGFPTITVVTPYSDLVQRVLDYEHALRIP